MIPHDQRIIHSSENPNWGTPAEMVAALNCEFSFVVDCAALSTNKKAPHYFGPDHFDEELRDALKVDWFAEVEAYRAAWPSVFYGQPSAFINPPYSRKQGIRIDPFVEKCYLESQKGLVVVAVLPASIQTKWWSEHVWAVAHEVRFIPHRVSFEAPANYKGESNNAGGNTAVVIWRPPCGYVGPVTPSVRYWSWK